jgi:AmpD protein
MSSTRHTSAPGLPIPLDVDTDGFVDGAVYVASPNCDERPPGCRIELVVIHGISLPPGEFGGPGIVELFTNRIDPAAHPYYEGLRDLRVSAHFLVRRDATLVQFVPCTRRAWHAGVSTWRGRERCNDFSVGIELEGTDLEPYAEAQYPTLVRLLAGLRAAYPIVDVTGHSDVAPGRKTDPGPHFDWNRVRGPSA